MNYIMGIDSGSVSLKSVIITPKGEIIKSSYVKNYDLMETLKKTLKTIRFNKEITAVGVTGTGQEFISKLIGADILEPEIVAHFTATIKHFPKARTILDIGGMDSKLILVNKNKVIKSVSFNLNCGAGTGGGIESIADELNVNVNDVGDLALQSKNNFYSSGKCIVFARKAVIDRKNKGVDKRDILMSTCNALVQNYFAMLGKGKKLIPPYVFQGATAKNKALIKCMENELNHKVNVPPHPELMGAYGIALIAKEDFKGKTSFKGFNIINSKFKTKTFICEDCTNNCEVTSIFQNRKKIGCMGSQCGKYE